MMIENSSSSNSAKEWDQARIKLMASGSTNRLTTEYPLGPGNTCISCKHEGLRDVLKLSNKKYTCIGAIERDLMAQFILETTRSS